MANSRKRILVTGASGLIGREICAQLADQHDVIAVDNQWKYDSYTPPCLEFHSMPASEYVKTAVNNFDFIFHMGAINGTEYFYSIPNQLIENNILTDLAIFSFAKTNLNCKLVYASSSEIVADSLTTPVPEEVDITIKNIHNPRWSYRLGKILGENYLVNSDINYIIFRIFNTYSEHSAKGHMLRDIINKLSENNFELYNPTDTRSFCYVADIVSAMIDISNRVSHEVINLGNDEEITVQDAADLIAHTLQIADPQWRVIPGHQGSTARRCPDLSKLRSYLPNYNPQNLPTILEKIKSKLLTRPK